MPPIANVAISNVPGPRQALYMAGAKMLTYYPVSIVAHSLGLNVTVQSYNGNLDFGLIACRKAMPDLPELAKYMMAAHAELLKLTPAAALAAVLASTAAPVARPVVKPTEKPVAAPPLSLVKTKAKTAKSTKAAPRNAVVVSPTKRVKRAG